MRPTALVTGAATRVGRAIALELAQSGFDVAIHYNRSADPAEAVAASCIEQGASAWTIAGDLSDVSGCSSVIDGIKERWQRLDLLVNNASIFSPRGFADISLADWEHMHAVNCRAPFLLSQGLLPLLQQSDNALVVHLCDIGADRPVRNHAAYSVSKAGLVMLVKSMAVELAPQIRTVGVSPGQVAWPPDYPEKKRVALTRRIPMQRVGCPEDVARLVRFLAVEGQYINGEIIAVDGGLSKRY